jgi:hypothetical protein
MDSEREALSELVGLRVRVEVLEQDLSEAVHLIFCWLIWIATSPDSEFKLRTLGLLKAKFLQMPQGFVMGRALIDLDRQCGSPLESHGLSLERWVFEPRERSNV